MSFQTWAKQQISIINKSLSDLSTSSKSINQLDTKETFEEGMKVPVYDPAQNKVVQFPFTEKANLEDVKAITNHHATMAALYADQENQLEKQVHFVLDASEYSEILTGYAYFEKLQTSNAEEVDYRIISTEVTVANPREYKLALTTESTSASFEIDTLNVTTDTSYKIIDNSTALTVKEGYFNSITIITADLSATSGNCSLFIDVDSSGNGATDFSAINVDIKSIYPGIFPALTTFICNDNSITNLDISNNAVLDLLYCYDNSLTSLDVSNNTLLTILRCYDNSLTSLDVSNNTSLTGLRCYNNSLTSLNVSNNTLLTVLRCQNNPINTLNVSNNTSLLILYCYNNSLDALDVSNNTNLTTLRCYQNDITGLDVSSNTSLTTLLCYDNSLTSLNVKNGNNSNIITSNFNITSNPSLDCVLVDSVAYANANFTNKDVGAAYSDTTCPI